MTTKQTPRELLRELIQSSGLTPEQAADVACVSIHTLRAYLKPPTSTSALEPSTAVIDLFALKTGQAERIPALVREMAALREAKAASA